MGKYFGTDGFRGEANKSLTAEHAYKIGRFLGWYYRHEEGEEKCKVVIGKDTRLSGDMLEESKGMVRRSASADSDGQTQP